MVNILFWIVVGALSGWIGYLATRSDEAGHPKTYLTIGMIGGLAGGFVARLMGMSDGGSGALDPSSILNALIASALLIALFVVGMYFIGKKTSS
jgi:uncharacterized membrane protein YeaQ/YmgE (transglycosylase-associated protein family)